MLQRDRIPVNPGKVEWSGDNPGIYLKETDDGDWRRLSVYFNIVLSPYGRGKAIVVLNEPDQAIGLDGGNVCITDNPDMTEYLLENFLRKFPTFKGRAGLQHMTMQTLKGSKTSGDAKPGGWYEETLWSHTTRLSMNWQKIGQPFAVEVSAEQSATGEHDMYSMFLEAGDGSISIDNKELIGKVVKRPFFGISMSSAFLAFSETWVTPQPETSTCQ